MPVSIKKFSEQTVPPSATSSPLQHQASLGTFLPAVQKRLQELSDQHFPERFWAKDATLWTSEEKVADAIRNRLGWLSVIEPMQEDCSSLLSFAQQVRLAGFTTALLLGMGGSSLCPEVCRRTFGVAPGFLDLAVLDSTDPAAVQMAERRSPLGKTLFLVATKSGTTAETLCFFRYFYERVRQRKGERAGENFVAITDPGSPLVPLAAEKRFRRTFLNPPDIGGRYSALSYFGLLPAALLGLDIRGLLERAAQLLPRHGSAMGSEIHPAIQLGAILAELGLQGRDKVTFFLSPEIAAFGCWVEQLLAESTGKQGKGLLPVDGEPPGKPAVYGNDRVFVHLHLRSSADSRIARTLATLEKAGQPVIRFEWADRLDLGKEFFRWEIATAVAAALWKINAFDEPNVKESKDNTDRLLQQLSSRGKAPAQEPLLRASGISLYGDVTSQAVRNGPPAQRKGRSAGIPQVFAEHLRQVKPGEYLAILAYLVPTPERERLLQQLRLRLRDALGAATSLGYGPRYLHSTGQLHKGGPPRGVFLQITTQDQVDLPIPSLPYSFGLLKQAQAQGDLEALQGRKRPILRIHMETRPERGLQRLLDWVKQAFPPASPARRPGRQTHG